MIQTLVMIKKKKIMTMTMKKCIKIMITKMMMMKTMKQATIK